MNDLKKILPIALVLAAGVAGFYFFWYKPRKDAADAAAAAQQVAFDAELFYNPLSRFKAVKKAQDATQAPVQAVIGNF